MTGELPSTREALAKSGDPTGQPSPHGVVEVRPQHPDLVVEVTLTRGHLTKPDTTVRTAVLQGRPHGHVSARQGTLLVVLTLFVDELPGDEPASVTRWTAGVVLRRRLSGWDRFLTARLCLGVVTG